jgi:hypothetical protein
MFLSAPGDIAPFPHMFRRNETAFDQTVPKQPGEPSAVGNIRLAPGHVFDMTSIDQDNLYCFFKDIVDRSPVDSRAFHGYYGTAMLDEPLSKSYQAVGESVELLDDALLLPAGIIEYQAGRD